MSIMDIGKAIREIRKDRGLTQIQLAEKVGMAVNSIRLYEAGKRIPGIDTRIVLAEALDCSFYDLMTEGEAATVSDSVGRGYWARDEELRVEFGYSFSDTEIKLIEHFSKLNIHGQKEAIRSVEIIAGNPIFQRTDPTEPLAEDEQGKSSTEQEKPPEGQTSPNDGK